MLCPASDKALELSLESLQSLLARWPEAAGVVLRFGDSDAARLPYLVGNDIYMPHCPRCRHLGRADRISLILHRFHDLVVNKLGKRLIARAWNLRPHGMLTETTMQAIPEGEFADDLVAAVRAKGQDLEIVPAGVSSWRGYWVGIRIDPLTGNLQGGTTRFFNGRALGY